MVRIKCRNSDCMCMNGYHELDAFDVVMYGFMALVAVPIFILTLPVTIPLYLIGRLYIAVKGILRLKKGDSDDK